MAELECNLTLLGSTAIEDKLQVGVPKCIADMGKAGIAVWVLTGDKEGTAINIAFACELFDMSMQLLVLNTDNQPDADAIGAAMHAAYKDATASSNARSGGGTKRGLVLDGEVIAIIMQSTSLQLTLLRLSALCHSVVACRCAPSQKAQLVALVKRNVVGATTLAIGDGANDVAMIQAAHVGVGISGQEGMQAANSADFSFGQFRFLGELLLVFGRNAYRKMATQVESATLERKRPPAPFLISHRITSLMNLL